MGKAVFLPLLAALSLTACERSSAPVEAVLLDTSPEGVSPSAVDGKPLFATYQVGPSDGEWTRVTLTSDGTAEYLNSKGETRFGAYTYDEAEQTYCFLGDDDVPDYCSYQSYDDGVMTVGPKDEPDQRLVMTRVE